MPLPEVCVVFMMRTGADGLEVLLGDRLTGTARGRVVGVGGALQRDETARGAAVPLSDGTAEAADEELEPEAGGGVATEVAVVEADAEGELVMEDVEMVVAQEVADQVVTDEGGAEEARDDA